MCDCQTVGYDEHLTIARLVGAARRLAVVEVGEMQARVELRGISKESDALSRAAAQAMLMRDAIGDVADDMVDFLVAAGADRATAARIYVELLGERGPKPSTT